MVEKRKTIGVVLGGGGGKGMAHIGVLKVLEENKIPIDLIVGTSMGAAVGGLFAVGFTFGEVEHIFLDEIDWRDWLGLVTPSIGNDSEGKDKLEKWIEQMLKGKFFKDADIPLVITTVDLNSGERVVLQTGSIATAIRASISAPPAIKPIEYQGRLLGDGWMAGPLPADIAKKMGMDIVIGVFLDTEKATQELYEKNISALVAMNRSYNILSNHLLAYEEKDCDVVIKPLVGDVNIVGGVEEFLNKKLITKNIAAGEKAALAMVEKIKALL